LVKVVDIDMIDEKPGKEIIESPPAPIVTMNETGSFYKAYDQLVQTLKQAYHVVSLGNDKLPLLDLRTQLEKLLSFIDHYNPLTFNARRPSQEDYLIHSGIMNGLTSYLLARWWGFQQKDLIQVAFAGIFHDIGNVRIDEAILNKPSKLTPIEFEELKKHTIIGYNILKNIPGLNEGVKLTALQHHERQDGSGYPLGMK